MTGKPMMQPDPKKPSPKLATRLDVSQGTVPHVVGMTAELAKQLILDAGFVPVVENPGAKGSVRSQRPVGGTKADHGSAVTMTLASLT